MNETTENQKPLPTRWRDSGIKTQVAVYNDYAVKYGLPTIRKMDAEKVEKILVDSDGDIEQLKVSFVEDLDSELEDELFAVLNRTVINKKRGWTLDLDLLPVELDILRISFSRTEPLGTFQVAFSQIFYDVAVESLVFNFNPRKPSQSPVLFNTKDGIVLADGAREVTEEEVIAEIRRFVSENFGEAVRKDVH